MNNSKCPILTVTALILLTFSPITASEQEQWLSYRSSREAEQIVGDMSSQFKELSSDKPQGAELPDFKSNRPFFTEWPSPMVKGGRLLIALDNTHTYGPHNLLYIDTNADGNLKDQTALEAYSSDEYYSYFGPVKIVFEGEDGPITYHLNFRCYTNPNNVNSYLYIYSGGWYEGMIEVEGQKLFCTLIDYNVNGIFNDKSLSSGSTDRIRISKLKDERNTKYVGKYFDLYGELYEIDIAKDGAFIKLKKAEDVKYGQIQLQKTITKFLAGGENGLFEIKLDDNGLGKLPVGKYRINIWEIEQKDQTGATWKLEARGYNSSSDFSVTENAKTELAAGEPIIAPMTVTKSSGNEYPVRLSLAGRMGESLYLYRNNVLPSQPKLYIKSLDGSYDKTFALEYG